MKSWCTIAFCGGLVLFGANGSAIAAGSRPVSAPLDLASVARTSPAVRKPVKKPRRKTSERLPQVGPGTVAATVSSPVTDPDDITGAVGAKKTSKAGKSGAPPMPISANAPDSTQFCANIADAAADARLAWQMKELEKVEASLRERIAELEAKRAEYEKWLKVRQDFLKKAEDNVVGIYSRMRPDAAAAQLASMQDDTAAAVLAKLSARSSSQILNEMEPARAAHLANTLSGLRQTDSEKATK